MEKLKTILPGPIRKVLGMAAAVVHRITIWFKVATRILGVDLKGNTILFRAVASSPFTIFQDLHEYQMPMVGNACIVKAKGKGMFVIRPFTDDLYSVLPDRERKVEKYIRSKLGPGAVFVDAGSNIGYYAIVASRIVGQHGKVIACEMMPDTLESLRKNIEMNRCQNITVVPEALSSCVGSDVTVRFNSRKLGSATISDQFIDKYSLKDREVKVNSITPSKVLASIDSVDCMKMDVEGAEMEALLGLGRDIIKINSIVFECRSGSGPIDWLRSKGFSVRMLDACHAVAENQVCSRE